MSKRMPIALLFLMFSVVALAEEPALNEISIAELQAGYEQAAFSAVAVTRAYLQRIERLDRAGPGLNSVLAINPKALDEAAQLDQEREQGKLRGPLHGVPVLLKDNIDTADLATTGGSVWLRDVIPPEDAFVVQQLREAGAIILGKANLSEWANFHSSFSSSGWSRLGGQVVNPYGRNRNPCGSSSGPAVAVAANLVAVAIGTETNGSIVCPAQANGVVGLKPTVGLWSRSGIIPISHSSDSAGPMTRTVRDAAVLLGALAAGDPDDDASKQPGVKRHGDYTQFLDADALEGRRLGLWTGPLGQHHRVDDLTRRAVADLESLGAEVIEIEQISEQNIDAEAFEVLLHEFHHGMNLYLDRLGERSPFTDYPALVEAIRGDAEETARFDRALLFQALERDSLENERYREALASMHRHSREEGIDKVLAEHNLDAIIAPSGSPAWMTDLVLGDNFRLSSSSPSARAGYPIISVPMGQIDGLPVGLSFFAGAWSEPTLLALAYAYEQSTGHRVAPALQ